VVLVDLWECWQKLRPGGSIKGKWRILDEKDESGLDHKFRAPWW
jgi:hypothetical protein